MTDGTSMLSACEECGGKKGHIAECSRNSCSECGGKRGHVAGCSLDICHDCGAKGGKHTTQCTIGAATPPPVRACVQCGGKNGHTPACSLNVACEACGGKNGHTPSCPGVWGLQRALAASTQGSSTPTINIVNVTQGQAPAPVVMNDEESEEGQDEHGCFYFCLYSWYVLSQSLCVFLKNGTSTLADLKNTGVSAAVALAVLTAGAG